VENNLTPRDEKTPEQIQAEMASTREALTNKVSALENQVVGTAKTAADTISETVSAVKSLVETAPGAVTDTVKQATSAVADGMKHATHAVAETMKEVFDISGHVRSNPWASLGVSAGLGFLTGYLIPSGGRTAAVAPVPMTRATAATMAMPGTGPVPAPPSPPGVFDELLSMVGRKIREVAENVINTASASVNQTVRDSVPKLVDTAKDLAAERLAPAVGLGDSAGPGFGYGAGRRG